MSVKRVESLLFRTILSALCFLIEHPTFLIYKLGLDCNLDVK